MAPILKVPEGDFGERILAEVEKCGGKSKKKTVRNLHIERERRGPT
jgi:hypothetical protein